MALDDARTLEPDSESAPRAFPQAAPLWDTLLAGCAQRPWVAAHGGWSERFPENTLAAFRAALDAGAGLVELDFRPAADGVLVCHHDEKLHRCLEPKLRAQSQARPIRELHSRELQRLDLGSWKDPRYAGERMPTLEEALALIVPRAIGFIERKDGSPGAALEALRRCSALERVVVHAFDRSYLKALHALAPEIVLGALGGESFEERHWDGIRECGARIVHWQFKHLTGRLVERLHREGWLVFAWTVNTEKEIRECCAMGLDGITTDRPGFALQLMRRV